MPSDCLHPDRSRAILLDHPAMSRKARAWTNCCGSMPCARAAHLRRGRRDVARVANQTNRKDSELAQDLKMTPRCCFRTLAFFLERLDGRSHDSLGAHRPVSLLPTILQAFLAHNPKWRCKDIFVECHCTLFNTSCSSPRRTGAGREKGRANSDSTVVEMSLTI